MSAAAVLDEYLDGLLAPLPMATTAPGAAVAAAVPPAGAAAPAVQASAAAPGAAGAVPVAAAPAAPLAAIARMSPPPADIPAPSSPPRSVLLPTDDAEASSPHRRHAAERGSRWLRLRCGNQGYGLELLKVQEVLLPVPLLPLRGTPPAMLGVMNLRGQVVPVLDLGLHLGQPAQADTASTRIVVLEENGDTLGLRVSAVEDVVTLAEPQIERPEKTRVGRIHSELFRGIARQSSVPVVLLDASRLLFPDGAQPVAA